MIHRDIKPSNLMLARDGRLFLIDFGVASLSGDPVPAEESSGQVTDACATADAAFLTGERWLGTPEYMAPEQLRGQSGPANDVYWLGVTLYELLTHRCPFQRRPGENPGEFLERRVRERPRAISECVQNVPWELRAICEKAMQAEPTSRYASPAKLAADLRKYLEGHPIGLCGPFSPRRPLLYARRHRARSALALTMLATTIGILVLIPQLSAARAEAEAQEEHSLFRASLRESDRWRITEPHTLGWSDKAWKFGADAARHDQREPPRDELAATLLGTDARIDVEKRGIWGTSLAFDPRATRLLVGGTSGPDGAPLEPAHVWDSRTLQWTELGRPGFGPVAFRNDGTPIQVVPVFDEGMRFVVWNAQEMLAIAELTAPSLKASHPLDGDHYPIMALSAEGDVFGASVSLRNGEQATVLWNLNSRTIVHEGIEPATALSLSADGSVWVWGDGNGRLGVLATSTGEAIFSIDTPAGAVSSLALAQDRMRKLPEGKAAADTQNWLVAVGDGTGELTIWDVASRRPRSICRGMPHRLPAIQFSPDATLLVGVGQGQWRVWEVGTGRAILTEVVGSVLAGVAFAPDGGAIAMTGTADFDFVPRTLVYRLENGRGQRELRGLCAPIETSTFSANGRLVAALSLDWRIGVWDSESGELLHLIPAPVGWFADNVAIQFNPDGSRLYCASYTEVVEWDLSTGTRSRNWQMRPGLVNQLGFDQDERGLVLLRVEAQDGIDLRLSDSRDRQRHPRVVRVYDLAALDTGNPFFESLDFPVHVDNGALDERGKVAVINGRSSPDESSRAIRGYDLVAKELEWTIPNPTKRTAEVTIDPTGRFFSYWSAAMSSFALLERESQALQTKLPDGINAIGPDARWLIMGEAPPQGKSRIILWDVLEKTRRVGLGLDRPPFGHSVDWDPRTDVVRVAYGTQDGVVVVCDLAEVRRRLAAVNCGW